VGGYRMPAGRAELAQELLEDLGRAERDPVYGNELVALLREQARRQGLTFGSPVSRRSGHGTDEPSVRRRNA
jgi:hypothetical protein